MARYVIAPGDYEGGEKLGTARYGSGDTVVVREGVTWFGEGLALRGMP